MTAVEEAMDLTESGPTEKMRAAIDRMEDKLQRGKDAIKALSEQVALRSPHLQLVRPWEVVTITVLAHTSKKIKLQQVCDWMEDTAVKDFVISIFGSVDNFRVDMKNTFSNACIVKYGFNDDQTDAEDAERHNKKAVKFFRNGNMHLTGPTGIREAMFDIEAMCLLLDVMRRREHDKQQAFQLEVQLINSHFHMPMMINLHKLYNIAKQDVSFFTNMHVNNDINKEDFMECTASAIDDTKIKYNKDVHKAVRFTSRLRQAKVDVFVFHTGHVLMAGDDSMTSSTSSETNWELPAAMADTFDTMMRFFEKWYSEICLQAYTTTGSSGKKRKRAAKKTCPKTD